MGKNTQDVLSVENAFKNDFVAWGGDNVKYVLIHSNMSQFIVKMWEFGKWDK